MIAKRTPEPPEYFTHQGFDFPVGTVFSTSPNGFHTYWTWKVVEIVSTSPTGFQTLTCRRCELDGTFPAAKEVA